MLLDLFHLDLPKISTSTKSYSLILTIKTNENRNKCIIFQKKIYKYIYTNCWHGSRVTLVHTHVYATNSSSRNSIAIMCMYVTWWKVGCSWQCKIFDWVAFTWHCQSKIGTHYKYVFNCCLIRSVVTLRCYELSNLVGLAVGWIPLNYQVL